MAHICRPDCIYFPNTYSKILKEYTDKNGVKRRRAVYTCMYDNHRISKWNSCKHYKSLKRVK